MIRWCNWKWRWTSVLPHKNKLCKLSRPSEILLVFKRWCNCSILCESCCLHNWPTLCREKQTKNNKRLFSAFVKKFLQKKKFYCIIKILVFFHNFRYFTHFLIWIKCLVLSVFELTDVYFMIGLNKLISYEKKKRIHKRLLTLFN